MKANSERVKGKNFQMFAGKPLYRHILDTLLSLPDLDTVVINTDARHLLEGQWFPSDDRILIRDRSPDLCGDTVSMNSIIRDDLSACPADLYLMTHTTNPLLEARSIEAALEKYRAGVARQEADSLFTVNRVLSRFYTEDAAPVNHDPDNLIPTQDLTPWFEENSNLYIFSRDSFSKTGARIGRRPIMLETPKHESIDIDDPTDWMMAEAMKLYQMKRSEAS